MQMALCVVFHFFAFMNSRVSAGGSMEMGRIKLFACIRIVRTSCVAVNMNPASSQEVRVCVSETGNYADEF